MNLNDLASKLWPFLARLFCAVGTFTPTYYGSSTPGTTTYTTQDGFYIRIFDVCFFWMRVTWTNATGTGNGYVGALPLTSSATQQGPVVVFPLNLTFGGSGVVGYIGTSRTYIELYTPASGAGGILPIDTAADLIIFGGYKVA